jgi:hypothetical protein
LNKPNFKSIKHKLVQVVRLFHETATDSELRVIIGDVLRLWPMLTKTGSKRRARDLGSSQLATGKTLSEYNVQILSDNYKKTNSIFIIKITQVNDIKEKSLLILRT